LRDLRAGTGRFLDEWRGHLEPAASEVHSRRLPADPDGGRLPTAAALNSCAVAIYCGLSHLRNKIWIPVLLGLTALASVSGFAITFSFHAPYDDEGLFLMLLRRWFAGEPLYDRVWTIHAPLYYGYEWTVHHLLGIPLSHESIRWISLVFWITSTFLLFVLVHRLTQSLVISALAFWIGFGMLGFIGAEPAHPQEMCVLLLVLMAMAACLPMARTPRMVLLGALAGAMLVTKINLGIFAAAALVTALVTTRPWRSAVYGATLLLPVGLMWGHLREPWALVYCAVVVLSLAGILAVLPGSKPDWRMGWREVLWAALGWMVAVSASCAFAMLHGSTPTAMFRMLVVEPATTFLRVWYFPSRIRAIEVAWACAALWLAWRARRNRLPPPWIALLKMGLGAGTALVIVGSVGNDLLGLGLPFQWLIVMPHEHAPARRLGSSGRMTLATLSVLASLYAYPVAGSQVWVACLIPLTVGAICFAEGLTDARAFFPERFRPATLRTVGVVAALLLAAAFGWRTWWVVYQYRSFEPLGLPGTRYVRLASAQAEELRGLASAVSENCGTLIAIPSLPSLNLWTGAYLPPELTWQFWMRSVDDATQQRIVRDLSRTPRVCAISAPGLAGFWMNGVDISQRPLVRYVGEKFRPVMSVGEYTLLRQ